MSVRRFHRPCPSARGPSTHRGWALIYLIGGFFVSALVLGICVPLFIAAQRQAEAGICRARVHETAREITAHFREDVRRAARVEIGEAGGLLRLSRASGPGGAGAVLYRQTASGLLREVSGASGGRLEEQTLFSRPRADAHFRREGSGVRAMVQVRHRYGRGREVRFALSCSAAPRIGR